MSKRASPTVIGVFVLVALALAVTGILALGGLRIFREEMTWVAFFDQDVSGLSVGSPVLFRGAQIGQVSAVKIILDPQARIAAYLEVDPRRGPKSTPLIRTQKELQPAIDKGLRAQLRIVSFVTGQLSVSLDFMPHMPVILPGAGPRHPQCRRRLSQCRRDSPTHGHAGGRGGRTGRRRPGRRARAGP
jgi:phospholipid/cholesterol/gamma-HCH transport system substrate-binding protein